jgi:hypothetical protein
MFQVVSQICPSGTEHLPGSDFQEEHRQIPRVLGAAADLDLASITRRCLLRLLRVLVPKSSGGLRDIVDR